MKEIRPQVLISEEEIELRVKQLGDQITRDFANEELVVVCVLKGGFVFCSDLVKNINLPLQLEFIQVSSYGGEKTSSGECQLLLDLTGSIEGKHVLIVEDIVDTGLTLSYLTKVFNSRNPKSLTLASLLYKPVRNIHKTKIDYLGFEIEDHFVIGYGLDYAEKYRELPYIGLVNTD